ncbi:MAG: diadenylate cyclase CdaA [Treponema sp.]|nr:diadenylate cyclase CdaA [Treponema sp.]
MTLIFYYAWELITKTNAIQLVQAVIILSLAAFAIIFLKLRTLSWIVTTIGPQVLIIMAFVFQPELRKIFLRLGQNINFSSIFHMKKTKSSIDFKQVMEGAETLSKMKKGMLLIFPRNTKIDDVIESGVRLDADLTAALLITIFGHETPLHDGASIIEGNKIIAAGCFLQRLSERADIKKTFGTRHRAGLGLSEATDAVVLIVSEETGAISLAYDGDLKYGCTSDEIVKKLEELLITNKDRR